MSCVLELLRLNLQLNVVQYGCVGINIPKLVARRRIRMNVDIKGLVSPVGHEQVVVHAWTQKIQETIKHCIITCSNIINSSLMWNSIVFSS